MDIKEIRKASGLSQDGFAARYGIPAGTLRHWECGQRTPPEYVLKLLERCVQEDVEAGRD